MRQAYDYWQDQPGYSVPTATALARPLKKARRTQRQQFVNEFCINNKRCVVVHRATPEETTSVYTPSTETRSTQMQATIRLTHMVHALAAEAAPAPMVRGWCPDLRHASERCGDSKHNSSFSCWIQNSYNFFKFWPLASATGRSKTSRATLGDAIVTGWQVLLEPAHCGLHGSQVAPLILRTN